MGEAFGLQLGFMIEEDPKKAPTTTKPISANRSTPEASSTPGRNTTLCENLYKFDSQPKVSTWPNGYRHPIQEWEFCPLQQGHPIHPSLAFTHSGHPRPIIEIPPRVISKQASFKEISSKKIWTTSTPNRGRTMSESKARTSIVGLSPGIWQRKHLTTQQLNYDKNRPLPPLPLRIKKNNEEGVQPSLSFRRKREGIKGLEFMDNGAASNEQEHLIPLHIKLPPQYAQEEAPETGKLDATTPGMRDAEVVTIGFEYDAPSVPEVHWTSEEVKGITNGFHGDDGLSSFNFSFGADVAIRPEVEESVSPLDRTKGLDNAFGREANPPIKVKRTDMLPMKLELDFPPRANPSSLTSSYPGFHNENTEYERMREQAGSRCVAREEIVYSEDGVEERRYVYYPTPISIDLQRSSSRTTTRPEGLLVHSQPPYYNTFPPPPQPEYDNLEHKKKPSISSSRSQMTFSTFGSGYKFEHESQVTDCEDYEADEEEEEDAQANYTCASSFVSTSSYPDSEVSAGDDSCFTPVPQRLSAISKTSGKGGESSSRHVTAQKDDGPKTAAIGLGLSNVYISSGTPRASYDIITSETTPPVSIELPLAPNAYLHKIPRKSASASHLSISDSARPHSVQSLRLSSTSCNNLKVGLEESLRIKSVDVSRVPTPGPVPARDGTEGTESQSRLSSGSRPLSHRSVTPTPSMFRSTERGSNSKLRVIEEEPNQKRPNTAPSAPECQGSRSYFEDYDDTKEQKSGLSKVRRFLIRCLTVKPHIGRPVSAIHESETVAKKQAGGKKRAKKFDGVQEAIDKHMKNKSEDTPVPPRPTSRFSRISRISKFGRGSGRWRWSYAMMGATFS